MSESAAHAEPGHHDHEEHLEVWPDAGITETAKPLPWWLLLVAVGFTLGMLNTYWNQFIEHTVEFPKFGAGYLHLNEEQQYPGKINPVITTQSEVRFTVGKEGALMLEAKGGRGGKSWSVADGELPPGMAIVETREGTTDNGTATTSGTALLGVPSKAGDYTFTLRCKSGMGYTDRQITVTVEGK
jgi:hypothetical protein